MSKDETATPSQRVNLSDPKTDPNPPWSGLYFVCSKCSAIHQLGASDELKELTRMEFESRKFEAPPCWTCGHVNIVADTPEARRRPRVL
ncbi:MAG: hypothetical protein LC642_05305 [Verrucomicrobiaceae bacterium]|nr:hypothetical protein [Verrucomicrobiaceae bacterium]